VSHHRVEVHDLEYSYPGNVKALQGISFTITHGESVGIVGANGAGKSTLLLHLIGALVPGGGTVRVGDYPLTKDTLAHIRRNVGMIFQDPDDQLFMPTVYDDVAFGPLNLRLPPAEVDDRVLRALETVGALHLKDRPPYKLSGGEKRVVTIASVLSMSPSILVMDEPSAALDPLARRRLINLLATFEHTKIIATHDLDLVLDLCRRTMVLHEGKIIADGPTDRIFNDEALLVRAHLEKPLRMQACPVCSPGGS
jgi:cobalt/nickel transport system ATP-binding protein